MSGEDKMPLPPDVRADAEQLAADFETVGKAIANTQVAKNPADGVPGWIGDSADVYTGSIQKLGVHARSLAESFAPAVGALRTWAENVGVMISVTVPDLWARYDQIQSNYTHNIADLEAEVDARRQEGQTIPEHQVQERQKALAELRDAEQAGVLSEYKQAMDGLDDVAQEAANTVRATQDSVVDPSKKGSRDEVGSSLFDDIPVVDGQAEWEQVQKIAPDAAKLIKESPPSMDKVREFQEKYGNLCSNPFFAQALAQQTTPEEMTRFLAFAEASRGQLGDDASLNSLCSSLGSAMVLSTGGVNADPAMAQTQEAFSASRAGLATDTGGSVEDLIKTRLNEWKSIGNTLLDADGSAADPRLGYQGGQMGQHYGYEYLATMLSGSANSNQNLALGPEFFDGPDSLAQDIVSFDHAHGHEISRTGGYGNWGPKLPPGGDRNGTDPVESMFKLMDEPAAFSDGSLTKDSPSWDALSAQNSRRFDAVQKFLASDTNFGIDPASEARRVPPFTDHGPMNMTRYLTGFRGDELYSGTQDEGNSLGRVIAQASIAEPMPQGIDHSSPEYQAWKARSERSANIAANFLVGYQEGLEVDNELINGEDPFGKRHAAMRNWVGTILAPHIEGIANSLDLPGGENFSLRDPQLNDGYLINLGPDLVNRIIGKNGLFTDLAFDRPVDINATPDDPTDDQTAAGRDPAINTLLAAANAGYHDDMRTALSAGDMNALDQVQTKWAPLLNDLTVAPAGASEQVGAAIDESNARWKSLISKGIGMLPFDKIIGDGHDMQKWLVAQAKDVGLPLSLEAMLSEEHAAAANRDGLEAHNGLEKSMRDSIYQAISEGNYWGNDPARTPQEFLAETSKEDSFLDDNGNVIPYDKMTAEQAGRFRDYVQSEGGLGGVYKPVLEKPGPALEYAEHRRKVALGEK